MGEPRYYRTEADVRAAGAALGHDHWDWQDVTKQPRRRLPTLAEIATRTRRPSEPP